MTVRGYPAYRESGVEWLGKVPAHWNVQRFKLSVASCQNGVWGDDPKGDHNDILCIRVADFDRWRLGIDLSNPTTRNVSARDRDTRMVKNGDLLIEKSGGGERQPVGVVVAYNNDQLAVCSNFVARMQMAEGMDSQFWCYVHAAAYTVRLTSQSIKQTSGIQNLDQAAYLDERAAFPPPAEQSAIAAFLDRETGKIDALVAEQERLIALLKEKRQAVISHAVTKGLNPNAPMKDSGVPWLGEMPAHWDLVPIGRLCTRLSYGFTNPMPVSDDGPFMLTANDVGDGKINYQTARRTTWDAFNNLLTDKSKPVRGDVLLTKDGTLGRIAVFDGSSACINQSVAFLRFREENLLSFVSAALADGTYQSRMIFEAGGTTIKHIYISRLAKMPIAVPALKEATAIADFCSTEMLKFNVANADIMHAITLLRERRAALISAAVTGKIDVRDTLPAAQDAA